MCRYLPLRGTETCGAPAPVCGKSLAEASAQDWCHGHCTSTVAGWGWDVGWGHWVGTIVDGACASWPAFENVYKSEPQRCKCQLEDFGVFGAFEQPELWLYWRSSPPFTSPRFSISFQDKFHGLGAGLPQSDCIPCWAWSCEGSQKIRDRWWWQIWHVGS